MATERSSSESDVDLDEQIDRFDDFYFGDNGDDVEETVVVAVGSNQPGVAPYRHEPAKKHRQSKAVSGVESDAVAGSSTGAGHHDRPPPRLDNTEWCKCGQCVAVPTEAESVCCTENIKVWTMVETYVLDKQQACQCITLHPGFRDVCLSEYTLAAAY